jgi:hypothetical protein
MSTAWQVLARAATSLDFGSMVVAGDNMHADAVHVITGQLQDYNDYNIIAGSQMQFVLFIVCCTHQARCFSRKSALGQQGASQVLVSVQLQC